jgi:hypothetical protein
MERQELILSSLQIGLWLVVAVLVVVQISSNRAPGAVARVASALEAPLFLWER